MCIRERLATSNDGSQITLHQLFVEVCLVEIVRVRDVHVIQARNVTVSTKVLQELDLP